MNPQTFQPDDAYCAYCHARAAGICAGCRALVCADCCDLVTGAAHAYAVCEQCTAGRRGPLAGAWVWIGVAASLVGLLALLGTR